MRDFILSSMIDDVTIFHQRMNLGGECERRDDCMLLESRVSITTSLRSRHYHPPDSELSFHSLSSQHQSPGHPSHTFSLQCLLSTMLSAPSSLPSVSSLVSWTRERVFNSLIQQTSVMNNTRYQCSGES